MRASALWSNLPRPHALILSGGAGLGALQVGQLRALAELGFVPDLIVGTSVGAINGAFVAHGLSLARVAALETLWRGLGARQIFGRLGLGAAWRLWRAGSLARAAPLEAIIAGHLPRHPRDLAHPLHVIAVDLLTGERRILSGGDIHDNVLASAAIPSVFPAVAIAGRLLVDGGLAANVPLAPAAELGARTLVVLDASAPCALASPPRGVTAQLVHTLAIALRHQVRAVLPALARNRTIIYLPTPCPLMVAPHDFSHTEDLIGAGYELARDFLASHTPRVPGVIGHPHDHAEPSGAVTTSERHAKPAR